MVWGVRAGALKIGLFFQHLLLKGLDLPEEFGAYSMIVLTYFDLSVQCVAD